MEGLFEYNDILSNLTMKCLSIEVVTAVSQSSLIGTITQRLFINAYRWYNIQYFS